MKSLRFVINLIAICVVATSAAYGAANRTWVSHTGKDSNACTAVSPCLTFAGAYAKTNAGGEIDALDAGDFGPLDITKAITVDGGSNQLATIYEQPSVWYGINVNAGPSDIVTLRNLSIHGIYPTQTTTGTAGISVGSAQTVHIEHCVVTAFLTGISVISSSAVSIYVDDTIARDSSTNIELSGNIIASISNSNFSGGLTAWGVDIEGSNAQVTISNTVANGNSEGLIITNASAPVSTVYIANSVFSNNADAGVFASGAGVAVTLSNVSLFRNTNAGISISGGASVTSFGNNANSGSGTPTGSIPLQ
ncbi:MAG: right-handed parallel beta-helix repeat-containing protein [Terracidiphilus sp.]|jgi:hypothetical protein